MELLRAINQQQPCEVGLLQYSFYIGSQGFKKRWLMAEPTKKKKQACMSSVIALY